METRKIDDLECKQLGADAIDLKKTLEEEHSKKKWQDGILNFFNNIKCWFRKLGYYFRNLALFHKKGVLWSYRTWDYAYINDLVIFGLENLKKAIENGSETKEISEKKTQAIQQLIDELTSNWEEAAWEKGNSSEENNKAYLAAKKVHYEEIFRLIIGQDLPYGDPKFDGSGIDGWWD